MAISAAPIQLDVEIDISKMTIADMPLLTRYQEARAARKMGKDVEVADMMVEMNALLDRVVEGGATNLPITAYPAVMNAFMEALNGVMGRANGGDDPEKN